MFRLLLCSSLLPNLMLVNLLSFPNIHPAKKWMLNDETKMLEGLVIWIPFFNSIASLHIHVFRLKFMIIS